jgi:putative nucleotidyltransferase with HDIG domain
MHWELNSLVPLFAVFLYGVLFLVVIYFRSATQVQERQTFRSYLFTMLVWSLIAFLVLIGVGDVVLEFRVMLGVSLLSMVALIRFIQAALKHRWWWAVWVYVYGAIATSISVLTNWVVVSAAVYAGVLTYKFTPLVVLIAGPGYVLYVFSLVQLLRGYRVTEDPHQRNRLRYLFIGLSLVIFASVVNFTPLGRYPIDIAGNSLSALLIAYAILRHNLLDIRVVARKGLLYSIPTVLIGTGYFLIIFLALRLFNLSSGFGIFIIALAVAILTAVVAQPLRDKAQFWIDRLFFREKYDSGLMMQRLSSQAASVLDLKKISDMILEEAATTLHIEKAAFLLKQADSDDFLLTAQRGMQANTMISFRKNHPIVLWFSNHNQPITRHELSVIPQFKSLWGSERQELDSFARELFIPIKVKDELVGIFAVGSKRSEEEYSQDDQLTLTTLANQTAVAIENARLYSAEQHRREELGKLYEMARSLVTSDDMEAVANSIAMHAVESVHATCARILTKEVNGGYLCRAVYPVGTPGHGSGDGKSEPAWLKKYYEQAIHLKRALILDRSSNPGEADQYDLLCGLNESVCISPLQVGDESVGLLVLGEAGGSLCESFDADKLKLVKAISDQAASALRRVILHEQLEESFVQTVVALAKAIDARDSYTQDHSLRIAALADAIGRTLGLNEIQVQSTHWAAILHDIGKIGVADEILRKPGPLSSQEMDMMRLHPRIGADILAPIKKMVQVAPIILAHHERYDGSGYPKGLKSDQIPLEARILTVVDAYVAITDDRVYRKARNHEQAVQELLKYSGSQFDPRVVEALLKVTSNGISYVAA